MKPGKELDELIVEEVMKHKMPSPIPSRQSGFGDGGHREYFAPGYFGSEESGWHPRPYSTEIGSAMEVVDKLFNWNDGNRKQATLTLSQYGKKDWDADFEWKKPSHVFDCSARAETSPHAICLSALKAVGYEL